MKCIFECEHAVVNESNIFSLLFYTTAMQCILYVCDFEVTNYNYCLSTGENTLYKPFSRSINDPFSYIRFENDLLFLQGEDGV